MQWCNEGHLAGDVCARERHICSTRDQYYVCPTPQSVNQQRRGFEYGNSFSVLYDDIETISIAAEIEMAIREKAGVIAKKIEGNPLDPEKAAKDQ